MFLHSTILSHVLNASEISNEVWKHTIVLFMFLLYKSYMQKQYFHDFASSSEPFWMTTLLYLRVCLNVSVIEMTCTVFNHLNSCSLLLWRWRRRASIVLKVINMRCKMWIWFKLITNYRSFKTVLNKLVPIQHFIKALIRQAIIL